MALRHQPPFALIRVFGTTPTPSLADLQKPHIAPATSPASRNNRTSDQGKTGGGPCTFTGKVHFVILNETIIKINLLCNFAQSLAQLLKARA